jgi:hypothetical protein
MSKTTTRLAFKMSLLVDGDSTIYDELRIEAFHWTSQREGEVSAALNGTRYTVYLGDRVLLANAEAWAVLGFITEKLVRIFDELS